MICFGVRHEHHTNIEQLYTYECFRAVFSRDALSVLLADQQRGRQLISTPESRSGTSIFIGLVSADLVRRQGYHIGRYKLVRQ